MKEFHCYPAEKGHRRRNCSCKPKTYKLCNCNIGAECWKCDGEGIIEPKDLLPDDSIIITHNIFTVNWSGKYILAHPNGNRENVTM